MAFNANPSTWPLLSKAKSTTWRKLKSQKGRQQTGQLIVEGTRLVVEALQSGCLVHALFAADNEHGFAAASRAMGAVPTWTGTALRASDPEFRQLVDTMHSSGVAAVISWAPQLWTGSGKFSAGRVLFCDRIADPGNMGTLIRTAAGLGIDAVLVGPDCVEITNPKTMRATAGAVFHIPVIRVDNISDFLTWTHAQDRVLFVADVHQGKPLPAAGAGKKWMLVIGGEIGRVDPAWAAAKPQYVTLPMKRGVESFNAAVAGAILMDRLCGNKGL